jgi:hypothetical protein
VFENRVLRRIFGPKRDEETGGWRKLHNEELRDLFSSPSTTGIIKSGRTRWAGHLERMFENRNVYRLLVGEPEENIPLGRRRIGRVDNIKMDFGELEWSGVHWIGLAQDRDKWRPLVNEVMTLPVP